MSSPASASAGASSLAGLSSSAEAAAVPTPEEACVYGKPNYQFVSTTTTHQQAAGQTPKPIAVIKFSHDGKTLATAAADASVRLYNVTSAPFTTPTLSPRFDFAHAHDSGINDLVFTRDDKFVLTASDDKTIILWDLELRKPVKTFKGHTNYVFCLAVNSGGDACVSGSYDETLRIWDMKNARCTRVICAHSDPISAVDFNKSGTLIVSSSYDGLCRVWDAQSGRCLKTIYNENTPPVSFVRFSPNCKYLLVSSLDSTLRLWDYTKKDYCLKEYTGHKNEKFSVASTFSIHHSPKQYIVSGSEDGRIVWWDVVSKEVVLTLKGVHKEAVLAVAMHPLLPICASSSLDTPYSITLWQHQAEKKK